MTTTFTTFVRGSMVLLATWFAAACGDRPADAQPAPHGTPMAADEPADPFRPVPYAPSDYDGPKLALVIVQREEPMHSHLIFATGFLVRDDLIMTAAHSLLREDGSLSGDAFAVRCGNETVPATAVYADLGEEVLLLKAACGHAHVRLHTAALRPDEPLRFSALQMRFRLEHGLKTLHDADAFARPASVIRGSSVHFDEKRTEPSAYRVYREILRRELPLPVPLNVEMARGNSGGPIYLATDGSVVGMNVLFTYDQATGACERSYMIPAATLQRALTNAGRF